MRKALFLAVCLMAAAAAAPACGGSPERADPVTASQVARPRTSRMTVEEAEKVVVEVRAKLGKEQPNPLRDPKSLDDVLAILKSDQIDLFAAGVKFAKAQQGKKAKALAAQIEIAWGEDQRIVAQLLDVLSGDLREELRELAELEAAGKLSTQDQQRVGAIEALTNDAGPLIEALSRLSPIHLAAGAKLAEDVIKEHPDDYEGYRVLADYYRIRGDWQAFDASIKEVETKNPNSVGMLFLKGIAQAERKGEFDGALKLVREAVQKDPKFCRAQAQIIFMSRGTEAKHKEYATLKEMNPQHQLVTLAGPVLEEAWAAEQRQKARERRIDWRATLFP